MSVKPDTPITRKEMYLDVMTGGSATLPEPVTIEEKYLAKIAGMAVNLPAPVPLKHKFLAKIAGMQIDVPTYTTGLPQIYAYLAKAAGQDVEVPQPITREEMYWFDYVSGQPTPSEREYTGAVPVTFVADGTPLLDYIISGNTVQTGTPTPDNPIMPQGTGERTGNVMPAGELKTVESNGVTFSSDGKGKYTIKGTATAYASARFNLLSAFTTPISVSNGGQGTLSFFNTSADNNVTFVFYSGTTKVDDWEQTPIRRTSTAYNAIGNKYVDSVIITVNSGATVDITITPEFTNDGVLPETFEKFGYKIPISSANTTTPVYLGEVETTRKIYKMRLTNPSAPTKTPYGYRLNFSISSHPAAPYQSGGGICNIATWNPDYNKVGFVATSRSVFITQNIAEWATIEGATQWFAENEVYIWYVLAEPETGIVNEPLMRIGDYSDTLSMEQAGVQISTVNGSNTLDVLTTVKPSEVYIKYSGEPVLQMSMLSSHSTDEPEAIPEELSEEAKEITEEETPEEVPEETESITPETEE